METEKNEVNQWCKAGSSSDFNEKGRFLFRDGEKQIVFFKTGKGVLAVDNRCPHEGYPLIEGTLKGDCILACNWHGWTFDLSNGETLQGRDPVKTYEVDLRNEEVWVNLKPEDPTILKERAFVEFSEAMDEHDYDRIARSLLRYQKADGDLADLAAHVVNISTGKLERGFGHAHAGLADWLFLTKDDASKRPVAMLEALGHFAWDWRFSPEAPVEFDSLPWSEDALLGAVEAMDQPTALAIVKGAFQAGKGFEDLKPALLTIAFKHFAGFGHPAIYLMKAEELAETLGRNAEESLCLSYVRYMCLSAREDLIPEFRRWPGFMADEMGENPVPTSVALSGTASNAAMEMVLGCMQQPEKVWQELTGALALNLLHFDDALEHGIEQTIRQNVNWLDFTHGLTFAEAVYYHAQEEPSVWKSGLLQMACMLGRNVKFLKESDWKAWIPMGEPADYFTQQKEALFNMDEGEYIFAVHRLKMVRAVEKLYDILEGENATIVLAALNRYLSSRVRMRHPARTIWQAQQTVMREG